jgi:Ser/Thr protein kinase RdoA (MazF antagonist)
MSDSAIAAGLAVARAQGLRCERPVVLRAAWHVLVHLEPLPIVARVSSSLPFPEGPDPDGLVRELAVAAHLAGAGAPVIPPAAEVAPAPHRHDGHIVTFWRYVEPQDPPDPRQAGRGLRTIHEALADFDGALPSMGHPDEKEAMLRALPAGPHVDLLRDVVQRHPTAEGQPLHGDAHLFNCLGSSEGPLWHDFETACRGPREYDLAALVSRQRVLGDVPESADALDAYGRHDSALLEELLPLYVAWVTASMLIAMPRRPELAAAVDARLSWLSRSTPAPR